MKKEPCADMHLKIGLNSYSMNAIETPCDSLGYEERAEEYRSLLPEWQDIYDRDAWDEEEEEWGE